MTPFIGWSFTLPDWVGNFIGTVALLVAVICLVAGALAAEGIIKDRDK